MVILVLLYIGNYIFGGKFYMCIDLFGCFGVGGFGVGKWQGEWDVKALNGIL